MNRRTTLTAISTALLLAGLALPAGEAAAQTAKNLVGTWAIVSVENVEIGRASPAPIRPFQSPRSGTRCAAR